MSNDEAARFAEEWNEDLEKMEAFVLEEKKIVKLPEDEKEIFHYSSTNRTGERQSIGWRIRTLVLTSRTWSFLCTEITQACQRLAMNLAGKLIMSYSCDHTFVIFSFQNGPYMCNLTKF